MSQLKVQMYLLIILILQINNISSISSILLTLKKSLLCIGFALLLSIISHLLYSFTIHTYDIFFSVYLVFSYLLISWQKQWPKGQKRPDYS